jgi:hypothetical protein
VAVPGQSGAAGSSRVYTLEVPEGALALTLRTTGGSGDVSLYVSVGAVATPASFTWTSAHPRTNSELVPINRPVAGTYYITVFGETDYSGVEVLGKFVVR